MIISVPFLSHLNACRTARSLWCIRMRMSISVDWIVSCSFWCIHYIQSELSLISSLYLLLETSRNKTKMKRKLTKRRSKQIRNFSFFSNIVVEIWLVVWVFLCATHSTMFYNVSPPRNCFRKKKFAHYRFQCAYKQKSPSHHINQSMKIIHKSRIEHSETQTKCVLI